MRALAEETDRGEREWDKECEAYTRINIFQIALADELLALVLGSFFNFSEYLYSSYPRTLAINNPIPSNKKEEEERNTVHLN